MSATDGPGERESSRDLGVLRQLARFVAPYKLAVAGALVALTTAAGTVLALGFGLRRLVDDGFRGGDSALLDHALGIMFGVVALLALASYGRLDLVSWIGERVVAAIRPAGSDPIIPPSPPCS